jgi:hypothetical protein
LGATYGVTRHSYLQKKEDKTRDHRLQIKAEREALIAAEKKKLRDGNIFLFFLLYEYKNLQLK